MQPYCPKNIITNIDNKSQKHYITKNSSCPHNKKPKNIKFLLRPIIGTQLKKASVTF